MAKWNKMSEQTSFKVIGLDCAEEINLLTKTLRGKLGIVKLDFDVLNARMTVHMEPEMVTPEDVVKFVASTGMKAIVWADHHLLEKQTFWEKYGRLLLAVISFGFLIAAVCFHYQLHHDIIDIFWVSKPHGRPPAFIDRLYFLAIITGGWFILPKAFYAIRRMQADMNVLMVVAIVGAITIHKWFEAATVTFLFSVAVLLEHWSVGRARKAISSLLNLSPTKANVISKETHEAKVKAVEDVLVGDRVLVRPGEKIPLDGIVVKGSSSVNQAPITGESSAAHKDVGDVVYAGTINEDGALECTVTKKTEDTTLARIIHLVEEAQGRRSKVTQWVEKFARVYTPVMIIIAILIVLIPPMFFGQPLQVWFYRALIVLVIACPCALVISTPVSFVSGLTAAARHGVLIKGGVFLELPGRLKALALDKTGALTLGELHVQKVIPLSGHDEEEIIRIAAALEDACEHPVAKAVIKKAQEMNVQFKRADDYKIFPGKGAEGMIDGKWYWIGNHRFMHEVGQETTEVHHLVDSLEDVGHSVIAMGNKEHICGVITVADTPRKNIRNIIADIKKTGIKQVVMLTGDNENTAKAMAKLTEVDSFHAELLPEDKVHEIEKLQDRFGTVAMIGDGINDARHRLGHSDRSGRYCTHGR